MQQVQDMNAAPAAAEEDGFQAMAAPQCRALTGAELRVAKRAYVTARFDMAKVAQLLVSGAVPHAGDLVLSRIAKLGHHRKLESPGGRRQTLFVGDLVLVCYGARYASDQFEAVVPDTLDPCQLVAAGGIAAHCIARHSAARRPTEIEPLGLVADSHGRVLNLSNFAEPAGKVTARRPYVLAVVGSAMNAGKTTTVAAMIRGLAKSGLRVGAVKVTGTGAGCDRWAMVDAGAEHVLDFTDFGHASTFHVPVKQTAAVLESSVAQLGRDGCDVVVAELADGLLFPGTADLVEHQVFRSIVDGIVLAASESMSAGFGANWLVGRKLPLIALAGKITSSPLMVREVTASCEVPVLGIDALESGKWTELAQRNGKRSAA